MVFTSTLTGSSQSCKCTNFYFIPDCSFSYVFGPHQVHIVYKKVYTTTYDGFYYLASICAPVACCEDTLHGVQIAHLYQQSIQNYMPKISI